MTSALKFYEEVLTKHHGGNSPEICLQLISERYAWGHILENAKTQGKLHLSPIHGDPKVNNILIDTSTGQAISIVDLDTVKPGLVHYDIGDCLRSGCHTLGEETEQCEQVHFDPDLCKAILQGYLSMAREFLTGNDFSFIYDSIRLIAFELGWRFFTDYLEDNVYFKVRHPEHNLIRALVQFRLTESIESQETAIRNIIREIRCQTASQQGKFRFGVGGDHAPKIKAIASVTMADSLESSRVMKCGLGSSSNALNIGPAQALIIGTSFSPKTGPVRFQ